MTLLLAGFLLGAPGVTVTHRRAPSSEGGWCQLRQAALWAVPMGGRALSWGPGPWSLLQALEGMLATLLFFLCLDFLICKVELVKLPQGCGEGQQHTGNQLVKGPVCRGLRVGHRLVWGQVLRGGGGPTESAVMGTEGALGPGQPRTWGHSSSLTPPVPLPGQAASLGSTNLLSPIPANATEAGLVGESFSKEGFQLPLTDPQIQSWALVTAY